jgi:hypothetical protein
MFRPNLPSSSVQVVALEDSPAHCNAVLLFLCSCLGRAIVEAVSRWLPTAATRVQTGSSHVRFMVDKVALGQIFSEYFGSPCQSSFHQFLHSHHHLSSGAGTIASSGRSTQSPTAQIKKEIVVASA